LNELVPEGIKVLRQIDNHWYVEVDTKVCDDVSCWVMTTAERGHVLLEFEKRLRQNGYLDAEVFLEPKGDINALRLRLRGVKTDA
jgi:hypothetical protein